MRVKFTKQLARRSLGQVKPPIHGCYRGYSHPPCGLRPCLSSPRPRSPTPGGAFHSIVHRNGATRCRAMGTRCPSRLSHPDPRPLAQSPAPASSRISPSPHLLPAIISSTLPHSGSLTTRAIRALRSQTCVECFICIRRALKDKY